MIDLSFDNFHLLDSKTRKKILNDYELVKQLIKTNLSESRYLHSLSVADVCISLAKAHKVNVHKAYMAGLLHDAAKYLSEQECDLYLKYYAPELLNMPNKTKHSFVGKYYLKEKLNYHDSDVLNAIYNHTICNSKDKLSIILFIADKREPLRNIDDDILKIAHRDLYKAYKLLNKDVEEYLKKNNETIIKSSL